VFERPVLTTDLASITNIIVTCAGITYKLTGLFKANWTDQQHNIPKSMLDRVPKEVSVINVEPSVQKNNQDTLIEEKERLLARLAEIDKILKG